MAMRYFVLLVRAITQSLGKSFARNGIIRRYELIAVNTETGGYIFFDRINGCPLLVQSACADPGTPLEISSARMNTCLVSGHLGWVKVTDRSFDTIDELPRMTREWFDALLPL